MALDLRAVPAMTGVGDGPARAAAEWRSLGIARRLARWDPVLVSSLASGLGLRDSDLDVVCDLRPPGFLAEVGAAYGSRPGFAVRVKEERTVVAFDGGALRVEIVGERRPAEEQMAYRHAVAHRRVVELGGATLAAEIRRARAERGLKTEPALARVLGLPGDAYAEIDRLATAPATHLRELVTAWRANRTR